MGNAPARSFKHIIRALPQPESAMVSETIGEYEIEYFGERLPNGEGWGAHVAVYGPSPNPMHRNTLFPSQHVSVETVFADEQAAQAAAREVALSLLKPASD
jgi:hypothetical protein